MNQMYEELGQLMLIFGYVLVKPLYYVLADPHFFHHSEGLEILQKINEKTNWRMTLCIPFSREVKRQILMTITNSNINLLYYNATNLLCDFKFVKYFCYKCLYFAGQCSAILHTTYTNSFARLMYCA